MAVLAACGPGAIPGDPEGLREAAHSLDESAALAESSLEDIRRASTTVLAGWAAPSAQGYEGLTQEQLACIRGMIAARRGAAKVLRECADELEAAQRAFAGAVEDERSAERSLDSAERGSREEHRAEADIDDARAEKAAAGRAALAANEHAARVIRALREGLAKVPATPAVPPPGTGLDGGLSDGELTDLQRFGSHMFSTGAAALDAVSLGLFGRGVDAITDRVGGDAKNFLNRDSPGYKAVDIGSMVTLAGALKHIGREALEEGGERVVRRLDDADGFVLPSAGKAASRSMIWVYRRRRPQQHGAQSDARPRRAA